METIKRQTRAAYGWLVVGHCVGTGFTLYASSVCDMNSAAVAAVCGLWRYTNFVLLLLLLLLLLWKWDTLQSWTRFSACSISNRTTSLLFIVVGVDCVRDAELPGDEFCCRTSELYLALDASMSNVSFVSCLRSFIIAGMSFYNHTQFHVTVINKVIDHWYAA